MMKRVPVLALLLWICLLFYVGTWIFLSGFLLVKVEVNRNSSCKDEPFCKHDSSHTEHFCWSEPRFKRAVILIIDALQYDFARFDPEIKDPRPFQNKLRVLSEVVASRPAHARLYPFRADPPTTTMQRIKGFTTGSLPTFVDVCSNFGTNAIQEDNLIHQLRQNGKRVVFMGDDTWENLFPNQFHQSLPFPSFIVKDLHTVDNGILQHLYSTVESSDWDVVIAHFLGVDHCGHRYGPDHQAMADKLTQMDQVVRSVIERLQNDTLLVVLGDHGMTDTGDHGGDSQKETDAALFLFSPSALFTAGQEKALQEVVPQIDLVPTLAQLLGIPIPYSNIGKVMVELFALGSPEDQSSQERRQAEALWINANQVNRYLDTYSLANKDLSPVILAHLKDMFLLAATEYKALFGGPLAGGPEHSSRVQALIATFQQYLNQVRETCQASWARFHPLRMAAGIAVLVAACALCFITSDFADVVGASYRRLLWIPVVSGTVAGGGVSLWQFITGSEVEVLSSLGMAALVSQLSFFWNFSRRKVTRVFAHKPSDLLNATADAAERRPALTWPSVPLTIFFLRCASLFSDSYVVAEGRVVTFLLSTLAIYIPVQLNWAGRLMLPFEAQKFSPQCLPPQPSTPAAFSSYKKESLTLLGCTGFLVASLYASHSFHGCRDEQGDCEPSAFLTPLSGLRDIQLRNFRYLLSVSSVIAWVCLVRRWMRHYGNMNSRSPAVLMARCGLPLVATFVCLYWAMSSAPAEGFGNLQEVVKLALLVFPRAVYVLFGLGVAVVCWDPLTVFLKTRKELAPSLLPPTYRASTGVSLQAELQHLIPHIYQRMRKSLRAGEREGVGREDDGQPTVEAYGLGTVYSAPLLLVLALLGLVLAMLHPEGLMLSFMLLLLQACAVLHMHSAATSLSTLGSCAGCFSVSWSAVLMWGLAATQFFYSTGHLPTFPSIQWNSAFVGLSEVHAGHLAPALLVTLNTFSSQILFAVSCPLLLLWPLVCESTKAGKRGRRAGEGEDGEEAVMEMRLREDPDRFSTALLQLGARYLFIHGAQLLASVCAAAILRRHLMVWKIFAPKFIFEASGFAVTSVCLLLGLALVMRVDSAVSDWFKRLIPDHSR
ncbi:GPI ethanolamine phosphate transferase 3-like isoform X1 [Polyodon spathula]|uniref:GPI ethanolamine phosphate transferase 3-like isoform X1 n=2 Tax=Polyodon spathula TaxID=7913 RepID=UPI001B7F7366|nr:GPI ethanolamine phosphate transferase 3-like isoform X1 [Polyodon spathula]